MISLLLALWVRFLSSNPAPCGEEHFVAHPNQSIQLSQIVPGTKIVFQYACQTKGFGHTRAQDSGVRHTLAFEVDATQHAFYLKDEALVQAKVYLSRHCRCPPLAYDHLKGSIEGHQKASGQWEIAINLAAMNASGKEVVKLNSTGIYRVL